MGDLLLLAVAGGIVYQSPWPLTPVYVALCVASVALGAVLLVWPFVLQYRAEVKLGEAEALSAAITQMENLRQIQEQIAGATNQWTNIQGDADRTTQAAQAIAERMTAEQTAFQEWFAKANDSEKATLRLEVDKLRRMEREWLQVLVHVLDHTYGLYTAAASSGQPRLIEQLGQFQFVCRDAARRVGLVPFEAASGEPFNAEIHQLVASETPVPEGARVGRTLATGIRFQGQLVRPALVELPVPEPPPVEVAPEIIEPPVSLPDAISADTASSGAEAAPVLVETAAPEVVAESTPPPAMPAEQKPDPQQTLL